MEPSSADAEIPNEELPDQASESDDAEPQSQRRQTRLLQKPLYVVINGASGSNKADDVRDAIVERLQAAKRDFRVYVVKNPKDVERFTEQAVSQAQASHGCVLVAGGDGTINTVANAAYAADCELGVIPLGTFNYTGRTYNIPTDPGEATDALLRGRATNIQAGMVNDRLFLVNAGLGFHAHILRQREKHKAQLGRSQLVALFSAIMSLRDLPARLTLDVEHDGVKERVTVAALFVGNNVLQLQQTGLLDERPLPRQTLMGVALDPITPWQMVKLGYLAARGKVAEDEHVRNFPVHTLAVTPRRRSKKARVAIDGEVVLMQWPVMFSVAPRPLKLLLPEDAG
jgi:diacylglycerol kinase family enzyme